MMTVVDVLRSMQIEPTPDLTWRVGAAVRDMYETTYGAAPPKALRDKTNAGGTHCFAVYPEEMRPMIVRVIRTMQTETARQGVLPL